MAAILATVLRNDYERVDPLTLWEIATVKLPEFEKVIERMLGGPSNVQPRTRADLPHQGCMRKAAKLPGAKTAKYNLRQPG